MSLLSLVGPRPCATLAYFDSEAVCSELSRLLHNLNTYDPDL